MKPETYIPAAMRVDADYWPIVRRVSRVHPTLRLVHAQMGLATELGEYVEAINRGADQIDWANVIEELGDICWYAALACHALGIVDLAIPMTVSLLPLRLAGPSLHAMAGEMAVAIGAVADAVKRHVIYGADLDIAAIVPELGKLFWAAETAARACHATLGDVLARNLAKLRTRYPEGFAEDRALARDIPAEQAALRG